MAPTPADRGLPDHADKYVYPVRARTGLSMPGNSVPEVLVRYQLNPRDARGRSGDATLGKGLA